MRFTYKEYKLFSAWYEQVTKNGFFSFMFPTIDCKRSEKSYTEYHFTADGAPQYTNVSADIIECTMIWEEV